MVFISLACTKQEIEVVPGNEPPQEKLVTQEMKEAYVNRLYISLTGKKPISSDFDKAVDFLNSDNGKAGREKVIDQVMADADYTIRLYDIARADYLESVDTALIRSDYRNVVFLLQTATGPTREYLLEVEKELKALLEIPAGLISGEIDVKEMHKRIVNNSYYDEINMGTENFVVATFQNFLFRYPTDVELDQAKKMVDGAPGSLFLQAGNSKVHFLEIFFDSDDYAEGIVLTLYSKYLFRDPTTVEMYEETNALLNEASYKELQKKILSGDEYFFN